MSAYNPPIENVPIFDSLLSSEVNSDRTLTISQADKRYLRFPLAQGDETLQGVIVNGNLTQNGTTKISQSQITANNDFNILKRTDIYGDLQLKRPTGGAVNGGLIRMYDIASNSSGYSTQLYQTGITYTIINLTNSGLMGLNTRSSAGAFRENIRLSFDDIAFTSTNSPTSSAVIPYPDNSTKLATTAWVNTAISAGASNKVYTIQYTTTQSITLPANCIGISVRCVAQGGTAGVSGDGNGGSWGAGGSGGGGGTCFNQGIIPLYGGTIIQLNFAGYTEILLTSFGSVSLCRATAGGNGANAGGATGGAGGAGGSATNLNTAYADWSTKNGSAGATGGSNLSFQNYAQIPSTAGSPVGIPFSDTNFGCGQRWGSAGGINAPQNPPYPPIPKPSGICYITYYIQ